MTVLTSGVCSKPSMHSWQPHVSHGRNTCAGIWRMRIPSQFTRSDVLALALKGKAQVCQTQALKAESAMLPGTGEGCVSQTSALGPLPRGRSFAGPSTAGKNRAHGHKAWLHPKDHELLSTACAPGEVHGLYGPRVSKKIVINHYHCVEKRLLLTTRKALFWS